MSRSYLHDKYILKMLNKRKKRNPHCYDEMPKNRCSRYISTHCSAHVEWLEDATYCMGHKRQKNGHRIVSGLVRANAKEEVRKEIQIMNNL